METRMFNCIWVFNDKKLKRKFPEFWAEHGQFISENRRGFGYWIWKPFLILQCLESLDDGAGLLYLDAGCHLNTRGFALKRLRQYMEMAWEQGILVTQLYDGEFGFESLSERAWTKKQLLDEFDLNEEQIETGQFQSGIIFIRNNAGNRRLIESWLELAKADNYRLLTGANLQEENYPEFVEHRFDQSILSALLKSAGINGIRDETYWPESWLNEGKNFPIWAIRNTTGVDPFQWHFWDVPDRLVRFIRPTLKKFARRKSHSEILGSR